MALQLPKSSVASPAFTAFAEAELLALPGATARAVPISAAGNVSPLIHILQNMPNLQAANAASQCANTFLIPLKKDKK